MKNTRVKATKGGLITFLKRYIAAPTQVGAVAPSSVGLARRMLETIEFKPHGTYVEFGPGDGVFTQHITQRLHSTSRFFAIEANPEMANTFRDKFPSVTLHEASAADLGPICVSHDLSSESSVDAIISGLPWAVFDTELQRSILSAASKALKPGGQMVTFAYNVGTYLSAGKRFAATLPEYFSNVEKSRTVWKNIPPAFVYRCTK